MADEPQASEEPKQEPPGAASEAPSDEPTGPEPPQGADADAEDTGPEGETRRRGRGGCLSWLVLGLVGLFVGIQGAGIVLRDPLEGRAPLTVNPRPLPRAEEEAGASPGSRFGPGVAEVAVAPGPASAAPTRAKPAAGPVSRGEAPRPPQGAPAEPGPPAEPPPRREGPEGKPAAPTPPSTASGPKAPADRPYALQTGMFRSQLYRNEMATRLRRLGLPVFLRRSQRPSKGFRVTVEPGGDPAAARAALAEAGYEVEPEGKAVAYFYLEKAAQGAAALLRKRGIPAGFEPYEGPFPVWTVYAGPFTEKEAEAARESLGRAGIRSYLRENP